MCQEMLFKRWPSRHGEPDDPVTTYARWGDWQHAADWLDPSPSDGVDERLHHFARRCLSELDRAFQLDDFAFSRFSSARSSVVRPARWPASRSPAHPTPKRLGGAAGLRRDGGNRRPLGAVLGGALAPAAARGSEISRVRRDNGGMVGKVHASGMISTSALPPRIVTRATLGCRSKRLGPAAPGFTAVRLAPARTISARCVWPKTITSPW